MIGWKVGRGMGEEWKGGRMEGWKGGRMEGWKNGRVEEGRVEEWIESVCPLNVCNLRLVWVSSCRHLNLVYLLMFSDDFSPIPK